MSSSSEPRVSPAPWAGEMLGTEPRVGRVEWAEHELRVGTWTRLGGESLLGDTVTESLLDRLTADAHSAAQAQGYAVGWAEGRRDAAEQAAVEATYRARVEAEAEANREAEHRDALLELAHAAADVRSHLEALSSAIEAQAVEVAWALTEAVLGARVAALGPSEIVARVLQVLPTAPVGRVRLHPSVAGSDAVQDLLAHGLEVVPDGSLSRADAMVEAPDGSITDLRIDEAVARVREVLS